MTRLNVVNIDAALKAYYGSGYIGNKEIAEIFGTKSSSTQSKLKKYVREEEIERGIPIVVPFHVNVKVAFEVWGIDIVELEKGRKKLISLGLS